jgi:hypothetical protein
MFLFLVLVLCDGKNKLHSDFATLKDSESSELLSNSEAGSSY